MRAIEQVQENWVWWITPLIAACLFLASVGSALAVEPRWPLPVSFQDSIDDYDCSPIRVPVEVCVQSAYTSHERQLIRQSVEMFYVSLYSVRPVMTCMDAIGAVDQYNRSPRELVKWAFERERPLSGPFGNLAGYPRIYVTAFENPPKPDNDRISYAHLGGFFSTLKAETPYLAIGLNRTFMDPNLFPITNSRSFWPTQILLSLLRNLGVPEVEPRNEKHPARQAAYCLYFQGDLTTPFQLEWPTYVDNYIEKRR